MISLCLVASVQLNIRKFTVNGLACIQQLTEKSWLTVSANRKLVFNTDHDEIWKGSLQELGGEYEMMINFPIDPQLN